MPAAGEFFVEKYGSFFIFLQIFHGLAGRQGAAAPPSGYAPWGPGVASEARPLHVCTARARRRLRRRVSCSRGLGRSPQRGPGARGGAPRKFWANRLFGAILGFYQCRITKNGQILAP